MKRLFSSLRLGRVILISISVYVTAAALTVIVAHAVLILWPVSGVAERVILPVAKGLEFLDSHWKAVVILIAPFFAPVARDLLPRLRKAWGLEFDPVQLEEIGTRERTSQMNSGDEQ
jgi:hypothetical protein